MPLGPEPHFELTLRKIDPKMSTNLKEPSVFEEYKSSQVRTIVLQNEQVLNEWISAINQKCYEIIFDLDISRTGMN